MITQLLYKTRTIDRGSNDRYAAPKVCTRVTASSYSASAARRTATLRNLLAKPGILLGPAVYDGISAHLTEEAGFPFCFMSGFSVAGGRLAKPDTGLLSFAEMLDQGRCIHEATRDIPVIGDGDTGYGNAVNVKRTVSQYAAAGFAGILIEDQEWPKSCGHVRNKRVIPRKEAIARIQAACDARDSTDSNIVIVARTDARQAESFQEALTRASAFADVGADIVFIDALCSVAEMRTFCAGVQGAHKMANMLEGGGKSPILTPLELEDMGFKICAYPLSLLGVSIAAMKTALEGLRQGEVPAMMPSFTELQATLGFPEYFEEEEKYKVTMVVDDTVDSIKDQKSTLLAVEPDKVIEPGSNPTIDIEDEDIEEVEEESTLLSQPRNREPKWVRIKISDVATGQVNLDTRFPAGFLGPIATIVPQVAGIDLEALIRGERKTNNKSPKVDEPTFSFEVDNDRVEIFLVS